MFYKIVICIHIYSFSVIPIITLGGTEPLNWNTQRLMYSLIYQNNISKHANLVSKLLKVKTAERG